MYGSTSLTAKQDKILSFIERECTRFGRPPSFRDIAEHCGTAIGTVQDHVRALIRKGYLENDPTAARSLRPTHRAESLSVPVLGSVPAGNPIEAIEDRRGALAIPNRWRGELFALRVKGESMIEAGILDGDYVIVKKQTTAEHGQIVVALIEGDATVKTLDKKSGRLRLLPANPRFSPIEIPINCEHLIQGIVVSVQRFLNCP